MKMNKRYTALILILLIFLSTRVYADKPEILEFNSEIKYGPFSTGYVEPEVSENNISLDSTDEVDIVYNYKGLKDAVYNHMKNYENSFSINYKGDMSTLKTDIDKMWKEIFESDHYLYGTVNTYGAYSYMQVPNDAVINFTSFTYHTNKSQEEFVDSEVDRVINEIIQPTMSEFQKVKAINDWMVNKTKYSFNANTSVHAAYTLFKEGKGVCQAYALAAYRLLEKAGMEAKYVTGNAGSENHGWNLVNVDGKWYHLDITWNDPISRTGEDTLSYKYFLISDDAIGVDHTRDDRSKAYPKATDSYYEAMRGISNPYEYNNHIYYGNSMDGYKLYKIDLETMENILLLEDRAIYTVGYNDWIYYSNYSRGGNIYKVKNDGTENTKLNNVHSTNLYIEFPNLHFYDNTNKKWDSIVIGKLINITGIFLNRTEDIILTVGGQPVKLQAIIEPTDATNQAITWTSSDLTIATVKEGLVTALKAGKTTITATTVDGNFTVTVDIIVKDGYKILKSKPEEKTDSKYMWTISFSKPVKSEIENLNSIYIENMYGEKLNVADFDIKVLSENPTKITISIINGKEYERNIIYYVVVEKALVSEDNDSLLESVKMPFIIR